MRGWIKTLSAGALIYTALMGALAWEALPLAGTHCYDTRRMVAPNFDKLIELGDATNRPESIEWDALLLYYRTGEVRPIQPDLYNFLPHYAVRLVNLLLPPVPGYNLLLALCWLGSALAACAVVFWLTREPAGALLGGALFGFSPVVLMLVRFSSLDKAMVLWLPLLLLAMVAARERPSWLWPLAGGVLLAVLGVTNQYYWLGACVVLIGWVALVVLAPAEGQGRWRPLARVSLMMAVGLALLAPILIFEVASLWQPGTSSVRIQTDSPELAGLWRPWLLVAAVPAVLSLLPWARIHRRSDRYLLAAAAAAQVLLIWWWRGLSQDTLESLYQLPVVWRAQYLSSTVVCSVLVLAVLAGVGLSWALGRVRRVGWRVALMGLAALAVLAVVAEAHVWLDGKLAAGPATRMPPRVTALVRGLTGPRDLGLEILGENPGSWRAQMIRSYFELWAGRNFYSRDRHQWMLDRYSGKLHQDLVAGNTTFQKSKLPATRPVDDIGVLFLVDLEHQRSRISLPAVARLIKGRCVSVAHKDQQWLLLRTASIWKTSRCAQGLKRQVPR